MGILKAARNAGVEVPQQLAIAGFDNDAWTDLAGPGLTVLEQPVYEIGRTAMSMLLARLQSPEQAARKVVLSGKLVVRGSTRALAQTATLK
jgi:LacI family fructose operon transcriptional repressor